DRRLKWISVKRGVNLLHQYGLFYEQGPATGHSRLTAVQEYGRDGTSALPPETFWYEQGTNGLTLERWATGQGGWISTNASAGSLLWFRGHCDGDGKIDVAKVCNGMSPRGKLMSADVHHSTGSSFVMQRWATGQGGWVSTNASAGNSQWFTGDFNGDGKTDL